MFSQICIQHRYFNIFSKFWDFSLFDTLVTVCSQSHDPLGYLLSKHDTVIYVLICLLLYINNYIILASLGIIITFVYNNIIIRINIFCSLYSLALLIKLIIIIFIFISSICSNLFILYVVKFNKILFSYNFLKL